MPTYMGVASQNTARASAILLPAGAWDVAPTEFFVSYAKQATVSFTYTRGGAGGAFDWMIETSIYSVAAAVPAGAGEWDDPSIYASGAVAAGTDTQSRVQNEYETYQAIDANLRSFVVGPIMLEGGFERMRIRARESGAAGTPGTLAIVVELQ